MQSRPRKRSPVAAMQRARHWCHGAACGSSSTDLATLKRISFRVDDHAGVLSIEASEPVPYVVSQPDPKMFVVEMRDVLATSVADSFKIDPRVPVSAVRVENAHAFDGATTARVSLSLEQPIRPRVRSSKNMIYIETDRIDRAAAGVIGSVGPSSVIRDLQRGPAARRVDGHHAVQGIGRLVTTNVEESKDGPARLYIDLANTTSALPGLTPVAQGAVQNVRIGLRRREPDGRRAGRRGAVAQVDLPTCEPSTDGQALTVIFDDAAPESAQANAASLLTQGPAQRTAQKPIAVMAQAQTAPATVLAPPAPAPAAPAQAQGPAGGSAPQPNGSAQATSLNGPVAPRYTGHPVSLDFQGADLRAVLRTFAEISGLNIVIDPTIQGTVDVSLRDVPWDQALDIILRANKLGYVVDGTIVRIAPLAVLADEETQRRKLSDEQALSGDLRVFTRSLSYARADEMRPLLLATVLSARGTIQTDVRTNTLIINDLPDRLQRASDLITTLDSPQPQVEIEARIVQTTREFARNLGVQWGVNGQVSPALGNTTGLSFPNSGSLTGQTGAAAGVTGDPTVAPSGGTASQPRRRRRQQRAPDWRSDPLTARSTSTWRCRRSRARARGESCQRRA